MEQSPHTPHRVIATRVRELRKRRGWSAERLAQEMTAVGIPWERMVVTKLETGRRQSVSVEELLALCWVLSVAPVHLIVSSELASATPYQVTPKGDPLPASFVRGWIRGNAPVDMATFDLDPAGLPSGPDWRRYFEEIPPEEWGWNMESALMMRELLPAEGDDDGERQ